MPDSQSFIYTYSAAEQEEIAAIRRKYTVETESAVPDRLETLRRLDRAVTRKATVTAITVGVVCTLLMGGGMSLILTDLGVQLGLSAPFLPGLLIGAVGLFGVVAAYPLYWRVLRRERRRTAPKIRELTDTAPHI